MVKFAKQLKSLRSELNISQKQLANDLKVDQSTVGKWETGQREPDLNMLCKIAAYFKVTVGYLLGVEN